MEEHPAEPVGDPEVEAEVEPKSDRRILWFLVSPLIVIWVGSLAANAFLPALATKHPLALIAIDPRLRNLVIARHVDVVLFFLVAVPRRILTDPLYFLLGRLYGDAAIRWIERNSGAGQVVQWTERAFAKAKYPIVFLWPGPLVCALAGATRMKLTGFLIANFSGTIVAVIVARLLGDALGGPVDWLLDLFNRNLLLTTIISFALVALSLMLGRVDTEPSVKELEEEIESEEGSQGRPEE